MQVDKIYTTKSAEETQQLGGKIAQEVLSVGPRTGAVIIALQGDLGAGKTTFTQGFAKGLGVKDKILSPTFVVMKHFMIENSLFKSFYHIDCYRMESEQDMKELGLEEVFQNPENIVLVEWPERIKNILPQDVVKIAFNHSNVFEREIVIQ